MHVGPPPLPVDAREQNLRLAYVAGVQFPTAHRGAFWVSASSLHGKPPQCVKVGVCGGGFYDSRLIEGYRFFQEIERVLELYSGFFGLQDKLKQSG